MLAPPGHAVVPLLADMPIRLPTYQGLPLFEAQLLKGQTDGKPRACLDRFEHDSLRVSLSVKQFYNKVEKI